MDSVLAGLLTLWCGFYRQVRRQVLLAAGIGGLQPCPIPVRSSGRRSDPHSAAVWRSRRWAGRTCGGIDPPDAGWWAPSAIDW
ncbi:MAG: hypothetical protein Q8K78_12555 [Planctomycetaceae bacterium]|nr:hypothetical protein [Planctomycetaceae bacterium]